MTKRDLRLICIFTGILIAVFVISLNWAYNSTKNNYVVDEKIDLEDLRIEDQENIEIVQASTAITVKEKGEVVYQYYYAFDSVVKEIVEEIQPYLVGATREQMIDIFPDWQLLLFSEDKIILRQIIEAKSTEIYCIADVDGYIAIFNENDKKQMKLLEKTTIPVNVLPIFEQEQLKNGINAIGQENLVRILADLSI